MKRVICSLLMFASACMLVVFVTGMECNSIPVNKAVTGGVLSIIVFAISGKVGGIIE